MVFASTRFCVGTSSRCARPDRGFCGCNALLALENGKILLTGATFWLDPQLKKHLPDGGSDVAYSGIGSPESCLVTLVQARIAIRTEIPFCSSRMHPEGGPARRRHIAAHLFWGKEMTVGIRRRWLGVDSMETFFRIWSMAMNFRSKWFEDLWNLIVSVPGSLLAHPSQ